MSAPAKREQASREEREQASRQDKRTACYVYGIVPSDVEVADDVRGVGDPPGKLRIVRDGDLAALVSDVDPTRPLGTPDDLIAHERLLDAIATEVPVLPVRFGAVLEGEHAVADELVAAHHDDFAGALSELEGRAEYLVKGRYVEQSILAEILRENEQAAQLREQIRGEDEDITRDARIQLGEIINNEISARREADTRAAEDAVAELSAASVAREPTHEQDAVHLALLVDRGQQGALERAVGDLAREWEGRVELRLRGPLAPYDFVVTAPPEG